MYTQIYLYMFVHIYAYKHFPETFSLTLQWKCIPDLATSFRDHVSTTQQMCTPLWRIIIVAVGKESISDQKHHRGILAIQKFIFYIL